MDAQRKPAEPVSHARLCTMIEMWQQKCIRERATVDLLMLDTVLALQELKTTRETLQRLLP